MKCIKCSSENVNIQAVTITKSSSHHSLVYWVCVGWWLEPIVWICLFLPKLVYELFKPNRIKSKTHSEAICQNCGYRWKV